MEENNEETYIVSIQYMFDQWVLHYAWAYRAPDFATARAMAHDHFNQSWGNYRPAHVVRITSVNITNMKQTCAEYFDGKEWQTTIADVGKLEYGIGPLKPTKETLAA